MKDFLPLGTIVMLKNATKRVMIMGYLPVTSDKKIFDYVAVTYPEGYISAEKVLLFSQEDIDKVLYKGLEDLESQNFKTQINEFLKNKDITPQ